jgi:hypothetical protein
LFENPFHLSSFFDSGMKLTCPYITENTVIIIYINIYFLMFINVNRKQKMHNDELCTLLLSSFRFGRCIIFIIQWECMAWHGIVVAAVLQHFPSYTFPILPSLTVAHCGLKSFEHINCHNNVIPDTSCKQDFVKSL